MLLCLRWASGASRPAFRRFSVWIKCPRMLGLARRGHHVCSRYHRVARQGARKDGTGLCPPERFPRRDREKSLVFRKDPIAFVPELNEKVLGDFSAGFFRLKSAILLQRSNLAGYHPTHRFQKALGRRPSNPITSVTWVKGAGPAGQPPATPAPHDGAPGAFVTTATRIRAGDVHPVVEVALANLLHGLLGGGGRSLAEQLLLCEDGTGAGLPWLAAEVTELGAAETSCVVAQVSQLGPRQKRLISHMCTY